MKRTLWVLLLAACASGPERKPDDAVTVHQPGLLSASTKGGAGWFPIPPGLETDPTTLKIPPLEFAISAPEKITLPNGLVIYLVEDHAAPLVSVTALSPTGSFDEPADKLGLARLTADAQVTGGTAALAPLALDELLEFHAADLGGDAGDEISRISLNARAQDLAKLLPVFADIVLRPRFSVDRFELARTQYAESIRRRPDRPEGLAARALGKAIFGPDAPGGRDATLVSLKAITLDDVKRFHAEHLGPLRLLVTGDFDRAAVTGWLTQYFGSLKPRARTPRALVAPPKGTRRVFFINSKVAQAKIRLGGPGFQRLSPREFSSRLVASTLGGFGTGRLYKEIRDERGLAYSASASVSPGPTIGQLTIAFDTRPELATQALDVALKTLAGVKGATPISATELRQSKDIALNAFAFRFDEAQKIAVEKATFDLYGYPDDYLSSYRARLEAVDLKAAAASVEALLPLDSMQIVIVGPKDKIGDLSRFGPVTELTDVDAFR